MRPFPKFHGKLPNFSQITNIFRKDKNQRPKKEGWQILPDESAQYLIQPKPQLEESSSSSQGDITWRISDSPDKTSIAGTSTGSTDSLVIYLDPSRPIDLDPGQPRPLTNNPCSTRKNDKVAHMNLSSIVPHQERAPNDHALLSAAHPSPKSLISDVPTLINPSDTPSNRTPRPEIRDVDFCPPEPPQKSGDTIRSTELLKISFDSPSINCGFADSAKFLQSARLRLAFPTSVRDLSMWTKEVLTEYKVNPDHDTSFRRFVHRQRIVEWRRYRVRHTFVTAQYRGEYLVVKVQDATSSETRFLYLDRLIQPKDAHFWKTHDNLEDWLQCVETEGCFDLEIDPHVSVTWSRKGPPESRDLRLIFGLWTPCDRIMMLEDWPRDDVKREGHVFDVNDQPDLLDLFIAARAIHLDANFSMFRRQDHWFTKVLSRVLNQKWDKYDVLSVTDEDKFDKKYRLQKGKWDRMPVSKMRHKEVLKLRNHCNGRRELIFVKPKFEYGKALDVQDRSPARSTESMNKKRVEVQRNPVRNVTDKTKRRRPRKLRKPKKP